MTTHSTIATLEYVGPDGHESEHFGGLLVAGRRYQCEADLAAYLSERHPEFWRLHRPAPVPAVAAEE
jgi:hypothetical protein